MPIDPADWSITRATGAIRYVGGDHGASPTYATVIELHRFLQDLADDASSSGDDEIDITDTNPSNRSTDNIITLVNGYNIDANAAEHLYDGSIIQDDGDTIYDGIVNFGNAGIVIQMIQSGSVLADDWWNSNGGLNPSPAQGISHRFMIQTRRAGFDIDGRRLIGTNRTFGNTYGEFSINGTARGNNVLALTDGNDLNNNDTAAEVLVWGDCVNTIEGYTQLDVDNDTVDENYYSVWTRGDRVINDLYQKTKHLSRDGSLSGLYGLNGEAFRGITHQVELTGGSGVFDAVEPILWGDPVITGEPLTNVTGSGQMFAIDNTSAPAATRLWMQLLSGVIPTVGQAISGLKNIGVTSMDAPSTVTARPISTPFIGQSTGGAIIGAYGHGITELDLTANDTVIDLDNATITPPNNVTFTVNGLVSGEDRVLVGPWDGVSLDAEGFPAIDKDQFAVATTSLTGAETSVEVTPAIFTDTPGSGVVRITTDLGFARHVPYQSYTGSTFTFWTTHDFSGDNATIGNDVWVGYIDRLADSTSEAYTAVFLSNRDLVVIVRDGGGTPIKQFITSAVFGSSDSSVTAIRTTDL
jgi:hypothetical protein